MSQNSSSFSSSSPSSGMSCCRLLQSCSTMVRGPRQRHVFFWIAAASAHSSLVSLQTNCVYIALIVSLFQFQHVVVAILTLLGPCHIATKSSRFPRGLNSKSYNHGHTKTVRRNEPRRIVENHAVVMVEVKT